MKNKFNILIALILFLQFNSNAQDILPVNKFTPADRYDSINYPQLNYSLATTIMVNSEVGVQYPFGVLLSGILLDKEGHIKKVFTLNSLDPTFDKITLDVLEATEGRWKPKDKNNQSDNDDIVIIPIVFTNGNYEYSIDRENSYYPISREIFINQFGRQFNVPKLKRKSSINLVEELKVSLKKKKYDEAFLILSELLLREPLNVNYYYEMIKLELLLGNTQNACQNLKFIKANFKLLPDLNEFKDIKCE
jgi:hypothetical protein